MCAAMKWGVGLSLAQRTVTERARRSRLPTTSLSAEVEHGTKRVTALPRLRVSERDLPFETMAMFVSTDLIRVKTTAMTCGSRVMWYDVLEVQRFLAQQHIIMQVDVRTASIVWPSIDW